MSGQQMADRPGLYGALAMRGSRVAAGTGNARLVPGIWQHGKRPWPRYRLSSWLERDDPGLAKKNPGKQGQAAKRCFFVPAAQESSRWPSRTKVLKAETSLQKSVDRAGSASCCATILTPGSSRTAGKLGEVNARK